MDLEYKTFALTGLKQLDGGLIEGYAAVFHNEDLGGDIIEPGAFKKSIADRGPAGVSVFIGHEHGSLPVGVPRSLKEDSHGLLTVTNMFESTSAQDVVATAKGLDEAGLSLGMSIGYRVVEAEFDEQDDGSTIRRLKELDIREYSFVGMPMNELAGVTAVKGACMSCNREAAHPLLAKVTHEMSASDLLPLLKNAAALIEGELANRPDERLRQARLVAAVREGSNK